MRTAGWLRGVLLAGLAVLVVLVVVAAWLQRAPHRPTALPSPAAGVASGARPADATESGTPSAARSVSPAMGATTPSATPASPSAAAAFCDGAPAASPAAVGDGAQIVALAKASGARVSASWWTPAGVRSVGDLTDAPAWSTAKVPLAVAAYAAGVTPQERADIGSALRLSDNAAADRVWRLQGADDEARSRAVTQIFRSAGDPVTTVPATAVAPGYSIFGQTRWAPAAQVGFLAALPCLPGAAEVLADMASVDPSQRWGIGGRSHATFKGGWGPTAAGGYVVRQLGWYEDERGARVPVAIVVEAPTFDAGTRLLDRISAALG